MEPRGISPHPTFGHQDDAQIKRKLLPEDEHTKSGAAYMAAMPNSIWTVNNAQV